MHKHRAACASSQPVDVWLQNEVSVSACAVSRCQLWELTSNPSCKLLPSQSYLGTCLLLGNVSAGGRGTTSTHLDWEEWVGELAYLPHSSLVSSVEMCQSHHHAAISSGTQYRATEQQKSEETASSSLLCSQKVICAHVSPMHGTRAGRPNTCGCLSCFREASPSLSLLSLWSTGQKVEV